MKNQDNNFAYNKIDLENKLLWQVWQNKSKEMIAEDFKKIMLEYAGLVVENKLDKILVDSREMNFTVVPELQDWINAEIQPLITPLHPKIAFVMPKDIFEQVSIQQVMDDAKKSTENNTKYFNNIEEAEKWILL